MLVLVLVPLVVAEAVVVVVVPGASVVSSVVDAKLDVGRPELVMATSELALLATSASIVDPLTGWPQAIGNAAAST